MSEAKRAANSGNGGPAAPVVAATTAATMVAFASNSILCRLALDARSIDPIGFTAVRLASGAATLVLLARALGRRRDERRRGTWISSGALFAYAIGFSIAYVRLDVGTGALILFPCVQATMIGRALATGERPTAIWWAGMAAALAGLAYLVSPGLSAPDPAAAAAMAGAGIAWGIYSLRGRCTIDPLVSTADNFVRSVPMAAVVAILTAGSLRGTPRGVALAVASGAIASAGGYILWYTVLPRLTATTAALTQLTVPAIAAAGGVLLLGERLSPRLVVASVLILGGVGISLRGRARGS